MALGPPVQATAFVFVYNPSQCIHKITNGQNAERNDALRHLLECITHSEIDLITLGSIWLCVTGLLTNEEQQGAIKSETRTSGLKCIFELIKIEQLHRRFFNLWLSFDFLIRYKIENDVDAALWLQCFYALTDNGKKIDLVDDRLRVRLFLQFLNGILTGPMTRNNQANNTIKELLTINGNLRYDELTSLMEYVFRHLNRSDEETTNINLNVIQEPTTKPFEILSWLIDCHTLNTTLIHYFIQNVIDLHDKYSFAPGINSELLQLITNHLAKAPRHTISVISVLCGIIVERLENPSNNNIDLLTTLLFVLTQTLIHIRQRRSVNPNHVQLSTDDIIHQKCFLNTVQQLPLCWLTILHQVLVKRDNIDIILINFDPFLRTISIENSKCALSIFDMNIWKMMDKIMEMCYQRLIVEQKSTTAMKTIYEKCLNIFEDFATKLCCLPHEMVTHLFDIKRFKPITRPRREGMFRQSYLRLISLIRPNNTAWLSALRELVDYIILDANEPVTTRIEVLTTVFDRYLWFKMTEEVVRMGKIILDTLENLIHIDLNSMDEKQFLDKHALMKQKAIKSIFDYFLFDYAIDYNLAQQCYEIIQKVYEQDWAHIASTESIHQPLIEMILEKMCTLLERNFTHIRLTSFNHSSLILQFLLKQFSSNYSKIATCIQTKVRLLIWQSLLRIRLRISDSYLGVYSIDRDLVVYGTYRIGTDPNSIESEHCVDLHGYLSEMINWLKLESPEVTDVILGYVGSFLKEQPIVQSSDINIEQLVDFLIDAFHKDSLSSNPSLTSLNCLISCSCYLNELATINKVIETFIEAINCSKPSIIIMGIQALIISLFNFPEQTQSYLPKIILHLSKQTKYDNQISRMVLEFLMHLLFDSYHDTSYTRQVFQILIEIISQYQCQTAHTLLLSHTILCFYFNQLSSNPRQLFSYYILRALQQIQNVRDSNSTTNERPARLQRSGSLSSLNDDTHNNASNNEVTRRKQTILEASPPSSSSSNTTEESNPLKKLNDDLMRITISYINDHLHELHIPSTVCILLPREVRRHLINYSWLADEKVLYQIKSYDFTELNKAKEYLANLMYDLDDTTNNRYRRYTDGNKHNARKNKDLQILTTCQDDLHIRPLELDSNRSIFNERNRWIAVTVRSYTSTKTVLAINLSASPGTIYEKNEKLHWFEAVKVSDTNADGFPSMENISTYHQEEHNNYSINKAALCDEVHSIISNIDRKDGEKMLNRHNENYFPQTVHCVPPDTGKSLESFDNVLPLRTAKIGVVYIHSGQEMTEVNILSNIQTSKRYERFMSSLAQLKAIKDLQQENFYCPLLDANNPDNCGQYAYVWQNSIYQVLFHTSTVMPNTRSDHEFKKKLIGNDYVIIIFSEHDCSFDMKTLRSGVCQYVIEVCPQRNSDYTRVRLKRRSTANPSQSPPVIESTPTNNIDYLISDGHVASYVRVLALCLCQQSELETRQRSASQFPFIISPWQNRLQALRSLQTRCSLSYTIRH